MDLTHRLALVAGARPDLLENAPGDRIRYAAMGGVIVSTATVAAVSAAMAVRMAMGASWPAAVLVGLIWGVIIFNLDRLLVVQMMRQPSKLVSIFSAVPRVLLALVLGAVISTPVVLQIFRSEIEAELIVMQSEKKAEYQKQLSENGEFAQIPVLTKKIVDDEAIVAAGGAINVESDPAVVEARKQYDAANDEYKKAEAAVVCEKEGTCGSGRVGPGIAFQEKERIRDDRKEARDEAQLRLDAARDTLTKGQGTTVAAATARLATNRTALTDLTTRFEAQKQLYNTQGEAADGLLARLEALDRLADGRPTLSTAHWTLFLLFLALELLPVLMKLLQVLSPETHYDKLAKEADDQQAEIAEERRLAEKKVELSRLQLVTDAAEANNRRVIAVQTDAMEKALDAWETHAAQQSAKDLRRWQRQIASADDTTADTTADTRPDTRPDTTADDDDEPDTVVQPPIHRPVRPTGTNGGKVYWQFDNRGESTARIDPSSRSKPVIRGTAKVTEPDIPVQRPEGGRHQAPDNS